MSKQNFRKLKRLVKIILSTLFMICTLFIATQKTQGAQETISDLGFSEQANFDFIESVSGALELESQNNISIPQLTANHLWVDSELGRDSNTGNSPEEALHTIQRAADIALPGTTIHILPGIYRESIIPGASGTEDEPIIFLAEEGQSTVTIRGSESSSSLHWKQLEGNTIGLPSGVDLSSIYFADLSGWDLRDIPQFIVELDQNGEIINRLFPAREPDWQIETRWKIHEFWWAATGGWTDAGCDPTTNPDPHCDKPWRSYTQLTDSRNDQDPLGIEPGNLTSLGNLTGATFVSMDAHHAHYIYRRNIISHNTGAGLITVDENCEREGEPALGWGSKYYVENHPALLDNPGEWWFDRQTKRLYLWSPTGKKPSDLNLEISRFEDGFDLTNRSFITLEGFTIELFNDDAYMIDNENSRHKAHGNILRNMTLRYANRGILLYQYVSRDSPEANAVDGFLLENSEIAYMDTVGFDANFWWPGAPQPDQFSHAGVRNIIIRNNEFHHLGYYSDYRSAAGIRVFFPDRIRFETNYVHDVAQAGVHFHLSLIDSPNYYNLTSEEILLGEILFKDNLFEQVCQNGSDCGALKFGGSNRPYTHVFRDVLVTGNIFKDSFGWSYASEKRWSNELGDANGLYVDYASGIHAYRNIAYNLTGAGYKLACLWRDDDLILFNNISANNYSEGFKFTGGGYCDNHSGSVNTQLVNNILINNDARGMQLVSAYENDRFGNLIIDHNLYFNNGWNSETAWQPVDIQLFQGSLPTQYFYGISDIQSNTSWEDHGVEGNPDFFNYDIGETDRFDGSWPDFHISDNVNVFDRGKENLPLSLRTLLAHFGVYDTSFGNAYDIGRYEAPGVISQPRFQGIQSGESADFYLTLFPEDFPEPINISINNPSPDLILYLGSPILTPGEIVSLIVTDTHEPGTDLDQGLFYQISINATIGSLTQITNIGIIVDPENVWLPFVMMGIR